jgi:peroxisomal 2,4-dienoyl-CoA reductase
MSRKIKNVNASVESLKKESNTDKIWGCVCDVRKVDVIQNAIDQVLSKFNKIDVLINGAAGNFLSTLDGLSYNAFKTVMEIDAHGINSFKHKEHLM